MYFRLQSASDPNNPDSIRRYSNGFGDFVEWEPKIEYDRNFNQPRGVNYNNENGFSDREYNSSEGYFVSTSGFSTVDSGVPINLRGKLYLPKQRNFNGDRLTLKVFLSNDSVIIDTFTKDVLEYDTINQMSVTKKITYKTRRKNPDYVPKTQILKADIFKLGYSKYALNYTETPVVYKSINNDNSLPLLSRNLQTDENSGINNNVDILNPYDPNLGDEDDPGGSSLPSNQYTFYETPIDINYNSSSCLPGRNYYWFEISSDVNERWDSIQWYPELHYKALDEDAVIYAGVKYDVFSKKIGDGYHCSAVGDRQTEGYDNTTIHCTYNIQFSNKNGAVNVKYLPYTFLLINSLGDIIYKTKGTFSTSINGSFYRQTTRNYDYVNNLKPVLYINDTIADGWKVSNQSFYIYRDCFRKKTGIFGWDWINKDARWDVYYTAIDSLEVYCKRNEKELKTGPMYRGWGQFEYNASGDRWKYNIKESELTSDIDTLSTELNNRIAKTTLFSIKPDVYRFTKWQGLNEHMFVDKSTISTGRLNVEFLPIDFLSSTSTGPQYAPGIKNRVTRYNDEPDQYFEPYFDKSASQTIYSKVQQSPQDPNLIDISNTSDSQAEQNYRVNNAPVISSKFNSKTTYGGASAQIAVVSAGISASKSTGSGYTTSNFIDLNGDGYPDRITETDMEFSNARGGRDGEKCSVNKTTDLETSKSSAWSIGFNGGASQTHSNVTSSERYYIITCNTATNEISVTSKDLATVQNVSGGISFGAAKHINTDEATVAYIDINGDGLPDKIQKGNNDNVNVCFNKGYCFSQPVTWGINKINLTTSDSRSTSSSTDISVSDIKETLNKAGKVVNKLKFGLNIGNSVNSVATTSLTLYSLNDINGDGLVDKVYVDNNSNLLGYLNLGNRFSTQPILIGRDTYLQKSKSIATSANFSAKVSFSIWFIKITIGGSVNIGMSSDYVLNDFQDFDGDGYPDLLEAKENNLTELSYRRSKIGNTNKLSKVVNSLGGRFDIHYKKSEATFEHPGGKWVMDSVSVKNGIIDGVKEFATTYKYKNGKYDRREHEFLGFGKVIANEINTASKTKEIYRTTEQTFDVSSIYTKGNMLSHVLYDSEHKKYSSSEKTYYTYNVSLWKNQSKYEGQYKLVPIDNLTPKSMMEKQYIVYSPLKYTVDKLYAHNDLKSDSIITETFSDYYTGSGVGIDNCTHGELRTFKYNDNGRLGKEGNGEYKYKTDVEYVHTKYKEYYVYSLPCKQIVAANDKIYRKLEADWDLTKYSESSPTHKIKQIRLFVDDNAPTVTDFTYDFWGNIQSKTLPPNKNNERMTYTYEYDKKYHMYPVKITDSHGYFSTIDDYDYRYGIPLKTTDINGNVQTTEIDNLGRITKIKGPKDPEYTIKFEYHPEAVTFKQDGSIDKPAYAVTRHYDPQHTDNPIETVTFADGFGRAIQVKKDAFIDDKEQMIISGRVKYDAFGRAIESYYPQLGTKDYNFFDYTQSGDNTPPTKTVYDVLDRATQVTLPDNSVAATQYTISGGLLKTQVTDALGNKQATYTDGGGKTVRTEQYPKDNEVIATLFEYDGIGQLTKVTDAMGKTTVSEYDMAGRRTRVTHPASGTTEFKYDAAGNLTGKQTANLKLKNQWITYDYDYNRLKAINYPEHPENNVKYTYGGKDAAANQRARLILQEDGSGAQEFGYGNMGELTQVRRTLVIPNQAVATYVTKWTYDTWNRVQNMIYPDGETVNYTYDLGGNLATVSGASNYIAGMAYDKFEQRKSITYGNGTVTNYDYENATRRLQNLKVLSGNTAIMNNAYKYDSVGNVTEVANTASAANGIGGAITHRYGYDKLYRLTAATGAFTGAEGKTAAYTLEMTYDNLHNITSKKQNLTQTGVQFNGTLNAGYALNYTYNAANTQQIRAITDHSYRYEGAALLTPPATGIEPRAHTYAYDANGNMKNVYTGVMPNDTVMQAVNERRLLWDEENRLAALSDNGYVSAYLYDAAGERTVKMHGGSEGIMVNGKQAAARLGAVDFTAYVSPYLVVSPGGNYTKHIYAGSQRIVSKLGTMTLAGSSFNPLQEAKAGGSDGIYTTKTNLIQSALKTEYDSLGVKYQNINSTFASNPNSPLGGLGGSSLLYFYHPDHLGSSSLITGGNGAVLQHIEYVPYGEVFIEEKNATWRTPYKFNAKELDEETGLYYYGARYYEPRTGVWISVDPLAEKNYANSSYVYCNSNPINFIDPLGLDTFNINIQNRNILITPVKGSKTHTFIVKNGNKEISNKNLDINDKGLVEFPDKGYGFERYGSKDRGGDHYLNPLTAACLFGLTAEFYDNWDIGDYHPLISFGDMSNAKGTAPNGDHSTHGGPKGYSGDCIDFRYLDSYLHSFQGNVANKKFDQYSNWLFLYLAGYWGFNKNYVSNKELNLSELHLNTLNAKRIGGHNDHGHITFIRKSIKSR